MKRILLDSHPSTNDYALDLLRRERPAEGTVVQTMDQTRGRGQGAGRWWSEPGKNITMSMILYPAFLEPRHAFVLSQAVALAMAETVETAIEPTTNPIAVRIKWPNDVLVGGRKTAGVLIETLLREGMVDAAVVGVGLNVNQTTFPTHTKGATSLALARGGRELDLEDTLRALVDRLECRYRDLRHGQESRERIAAEYKRRMHGLDQRMRFGTAGGPMDGTVAGVDSSGRLLVRTDDGRMLSYGAKEVTWPPA